MALINSEKSIIRERNLLPFHGLDSIRMIYKKLHAQPDNLSSCHEAEDIQVFRKNRHISEKICLLSLILQGGIAYFAVFSIKFRFSQEIARNAKESVVLPDVNQDLGFYEKSFIWLKNSMWFHGMVHNRMFLEKSHDLSSELMSIKCVGIIYYVLKKIEYSML